MLAPASPVAPVTRTVSLMREALLRDIRVGGVDLVSVVGDDRRARPEHIEGVDEAMETHGAGAGEAELDDLRGGEDSSELPVDVVVDGMVVGREQVEELHGQPLLLGQLRATRSNQAGDVLVGDRVVLARLHTGLALAQLGAADPDELDDPATEEALLPHSAPRRVGHQDLRRLVGEDLKGIGRGIGAVGHSFFDDPSWFVGELGPTESVLSWASHTYSRPVQRTLFGAVPSNLLGG